VDRYPRPVALRQGVPMNLARTFRILQSAIVAEARQLKRSMQLPAPPRRATMETLDRRLLMSSVYGTVYNDVNGNGIHDTGEAGVPGINVYDDANANGHYDSGEADVTTGTDGSYGLDGLSAGSHIIAVVTPAGNLDSTGGQSVSLPDDSSVITSVDFGQVPPLAGPDNFAATTNGAGEIDLAWTNNAVNATGIELDRSSNGVDFTPLATLGSGSSSYSDTGLSDDTTYHYQLSALGPNGPALAGSSISAQTKLAMPSDLGVVATSTQEIDLSWTNNSSHSPSYTIERRTTGDTSFSVVATTSPGTTTYADTDVTDNSGYEYTVVAADGDNSSDGSSSESATTPPAAPSDVSALPDASGGITLTWTNSDSVVPIEIDRVLNGTASTLTTLIGGATSFYDDSGLEEATEYSYALRTVGLAGNSSFAASATVCTAPCDPSDLAATPNGSNEVDVSWTNNSSSSPRFIIQRKVGDDDDSDFATIATVEPGCTTYIDTDVSDDTEYTYRVIADNQGVDSEPSPQTSAKTPPPAPTGFTAIPIAANEVDLNWTNGDSSLPVEIDRSTDGGPFISIATVAAGATTFSDTTVSDGSSYDYQVVTEGIVLSEPSGSATAATPLAAPSGLSISATTFSEIDLTWTNHSANATGVEIDRSTDGVSFTAVASLSATAASYSDTSVSEATVYYYRVIALGAGGSSDPADTSNTVPLEAPTSLQLTVMGSDEIDLQWNYNSAVPANFVIERADAGSDTWQTIAETNQTTFNDTGLTSGTLYCYRISASLNAVQSDVTDVGSAWTM